MSSSSDVTMIRVVDFIGWVLREALTVWSARVRSGGWLKALDATIHASKLSLRNRNWMNSFAGSAFFENFQSPIPLMPGALCVPAGPAGLGWWLMSSAIGILLASAVL